MADISLKPGSGLWQQVMVKPELYQALLSANSGTKKWAYVGIYRDGAFFVFYK